MKRFVFPPIILICVSINIFTQDLSLKTNTPYLAGFKTLLILDKSRHFKFNNLVYHTARPIRLLIWYPASKLKKPKFSNFEEYVWASNLIKIPSQLTEGEKKDLSDKLLKSLDFFNVNAAQMNRLLQAKTNVVGNAPAINRKFPLIVLGNVGNGYHYSSMAEFLAGNGYIVIGLPSLGANEDESCGFDISCLKLQQTDMEFALKKIRSFQNVDASKIGLIAWSFSGLAVSHLQLKYQAVKAIISLDAATGYQYGSEILDQSKVLQFNKTTVPFLHFQGLGGDLRVPKNFQYFNSYNSKEKLLITFKYLQHSDFISLYGIGVRFAKNRNDTKVFESIVRVNLTTLEFLNAYLKNNQKSLKLLKNSLKNNYHDDILTFSNDIQVEN